MLIVVKLQLYHTSHLKAKMKRAWEKFIKNVSCKSHPTVIN